MRRRVSCICMGGLLCRRGLAVCKRVGCMWEGWLCVRGLAVCVWEGWLCVTNPVRPDSERVQQRYPDWWSKRFGDAKRITTRCFSLCSKRASQAQ
jgi:hypothetical protein